MRNQKSKNIKKNKVGNRKAGSRPNVERMEHPPQLSSYQVVHSTTLRFTVKTSAVNNQGVTPANLLDAMLVADTAIHGFQLFDSFKLKYIEIWGQAALGVPSTVGLQFLALTGDTNDHTDTSLGIKPAYLRAGPSKKSLASFWTFSGGNNLFDFTAPVGSIIDIHLAFRTSTSAPVALANALVGANPGEFYFRGLDGLAIAATNFPPPFGVNVQ